MNLRKIHINKELLFQIEQKQKQIGEYLLSHNIDFTNTVGVMDGLAGVSLLLSLFYRNTSDERYLDKLNQSIELINSKINIGKDIVSSYAQGIAGYAWTIIHLKENGLIEINLDDSLSDIDDYLFRSMTSMIKAKEYDSLHRAIGIGHYFLKRGNNKAVESIINGLYKDRIRINCTETWNRKHILNDQEVLVVDFGLAHGLIGILLFLYKCFLKCILTEKCHKMVTDNISFIINYLNHTGSPSCFPNWIECDKILKWDSKRNLSGLAWCYGDLSAIYVLYQLSANFSIQMDMNLMLAKISKRRIYEEIEDVGLCHGTSGIAYIYYKFFQKTGNKCFEEACNYWLEKVIMMGNNPDGAVGFLFPKNHHNLPLDLLTGISGIGAVFLSFTNLDVLNWDEVIFL